MPSKEKKQTNLELFFDNCVGLAKFDPTTARNMVEQLTDLFRQHNREFNKKGRAIISHVQEKITIEEALLTAKQEYRTGSFTEARTYLEMAEHYAGECNYDVSNRINHIKEVFENYA